MSDYFNPLDACPMSRELLHHRTVTTIRCGPCGYAEKKRQSADIRLAERKAKTGHIQPIPTVHFSVGVANFEWVEFAIDEGHWTISPNYYTVTEHNRLLTSSELLASILAAIQAQTKRNHLKHWVRPTTPGDWCFGHTNPSKVTREIATWDEPKLLSAVVAEGPYDQKKLQGKEQTLTSIWLYWTPERPLMPTPAAPRPIQPPTPTPSGRVKKEKVIKKEDNVKEEPLTPAKRSRAISSTTGIARATRRQTRNRRQVTDDDDELPLDALALNIPFFLLKSPAAITTTVLFRAVGYEGPDFVNLTKKKAPRGHQH